MSGGSGRVAGWDVLRGIAIALVMARHAFPDQFPGAGVVGVVMFFSLSGYLITGVLQQELERDGRVRLGRFYWRRAARLLPPLVAMVAVFALVTLALDPLDERGLLLASVLVMLTFTANLPIADASPAAFHTWTLATEEQFYLLWPSTLLLGHRLRRLRTVMVVLTVLLLGVCVATLWRLSPHLDLAYPLPTSWAVCFVIGAAARLYLQRWQPPPQLVPVLLALLGAMALAPLRGHFWTYLVAGPVVAAAAAVLMLAWRDWRDVGTRPAVRGLAALGVVSYGAYLWNYPFTMWLRPHLGGWAGPVAAAMTLAAAALSWHLVEKPVQRRVRQRPRVDAPL